MDNIYIQVLIQWVFLFALMSVLFIPAFLFRRIALVHNKKGWLFFLVGLVVGFAALLVGSLVGLLLIQFPVLEEFKNYMLFPMLAVGYALVFVAVRIFRRKISE